MHERQQKTDGRTEVEAGVEADDDTATDAETNTGEEPNSTVGSLPLSRILVTWVELTLVGFAGAALGTVASGPPQLVVFLATTLLSVGVLFYNVDRLVDDRLGA
ncbi:hypothetical protein SAMN04487948_102296 [Halogranum amylolyticum]|uniref:Uncharacterized protein n=1 Tax=Halogranum amylolyticum TaxID=660520 RepID=A0A1H8PGR9_9EURY|nr:hypothetical protein [Halogranum amylolyticum]SEO41172.1 hypothetical protein SAMN04487948_102296 [Halogranum amylolyticum]